MNEEDLKIIETALNLMMYKCPSDYERHEYTEFCGLSDAPMDCDACWRKSMFGYGKKKK